MVEARWEREFGAQAKPSRWRSMTVEIICGDSATLAQPGDYDCMIADPPYSAHVHRNATSQSAGRGTRHRDLGFDSLTDEFREWIAFCASRVKRWSLIYSDVEGLGEWRSAAARHGATYVRPLAWVRWSMPQLSGDRPPQGFELLSCYWGSEKGRKSWNGPGNLTHLSHKCLRGEGKHKAEKPLDQALDLVEWFTRPGDRVLDPCAGSGTVGLACRILGRSYVGYEIDPKWAARATVRLMGETLSPRDEERLDRWKTAKAERAIDAARVAANTARARAKLDAGR